MKQLTFIIAKHGSLRAPCHAVPPRGNGRVHCTNEYATAAQQTISVHHACMHCVHVARPSVSVIISRSSSLFKYLVRSHPIMASSLPRSLSPCRGSSSRNDLRVLFAIAAGEGDALKVDGARIEDGIELSKYGLINPRSIQTNMYVHMSNVRKFIDRFLDSHGWCLWRINSQIMGF